MPDSRNAHAASLRRGRFSQPGYTYLVTTVIAGRRPLLADFQTARLLVAEMREACSVGAVESQAWVVMPDHLHWLLTLRQGSLSSLMKRIKARSSRRINQHLGLAGRLWQPGYHDRAARSDDDLRAMARYIVANPVRAGIVATVGDYPLWDAAWLL